MFSSRRIATSGGNKFVDNFSFESDGNNDWFETSSTTYNCHNTPYTFAFWCKRASINTFDIVLGNQSDDSYNFILFDNDDGDRLILEGSDDDHAIGACSVIADRWYHFAVVPNGDGTVAMYQDAVPLSVTYDGGGDLGSASTFDSLGGGGTGNTFAGNISEIAIYNIALTASQVRTLYNNREPFNHREGSVSSSLTAWWRMGDGTEDIGTLQDGSPDFTIYDMSVNSNNAATRSMAANSFTGDIPW